MPFGINFGKDNKNTSQSNQFSGTGSYNQTSTPSNPDWVSTLAQTLGTGVSRFSGFDPHSFVAPANSDLVSAGINANNINGHPWATQAAMDETGAVMNAAAPHTAGQSAVPYINSYMDPALRQVVDATTADLNANDAQTRAAQSLQLAKSGAFGGSGAAIDQALTEGQLERARASTLGNLRMGAFSQALAGANEDASRFQGAKNLNAQLADSQQNRELAAAQQLQSLGDQSDANARANVGAQSNIGQILQSIQQAGAQSPMTYQEFLTQLFSGLPLNLFHGENDTGTESQSGTSSGTGSSSGTSFGLGWKG